MKNKEDKKEMPWWEVALLVIIIIFLFNGFTDNKKICVESCRSDVNSCLSSYMSFSENPDGCIEYDDKRRCVNKLDSCLDECYN
jgi:hypothetical protein